MMTYGDGVCDVNIADLVNFHKSHGKAATLTAVMLEQQKGVLDIGGDNAVKSFREIFDLLDGDSAVFEREPLEKLASEGQLMSFMHRGFWQCMDNAREKLMLEKLLESGNAPWKKWKD